MMKITYLGHASILIKNEMYSIVIDPYQNGSVPGLKFPKVEANFIYCTHNHYDHNAKELVKIIPTNEVVYYESIQVPHDHHNGAHRGLNNMYLFNIDGYRILHTGDLGCIPNDEVLEKMKNVDILFAPINGHYTISAKELRDIIHIVKPRIVIPIHYFKQEDNSGYPDGGQIDVFKSLMGEYREINGYEIEVNDNLFKDRVLIFNKALQE